MKKRYLTLEDGSVFAGEPFGAEAIACGEIVFDTRMNGWADTLADPCAAGQIIVSTFPLVGCAGVCAEDFSRPIRAAGYVVRSVSDAPSNFRAAHTVDEYLKEYGVPGISGVDTRALTRILREKGAMRAMITDEAPADVTTIRAYKAENPLALLTTVRREIPADGEETCRVSLVDYGAADAWTKALAARGCRVTVFAHTASAEAILTAADGIVLTGGAGDPAAHTEQIDVIGKLVGKCPIFAEGLGYQMLALAEGAKTVKLHHGHRGANHPVYDLTSGRTYITAQNHGYAVDKDTLGAGVLTFVSKNDGTAEGIFYRDKNAAGVQFSPLPFMIDAFVASVQAGKGGNN